MITGDNITARIISITFIFFLILLHFNIFQIARHL